MFQLYFIRFILKEFNTHFDFAQGNRILYHIRDGHICANVLKVFPFSDKNRNFSASLFLSIDSSCCDENLYCHNWIMMESSLCNNLNSQTFVAKTRKHYQSVLNTTAAWHRSSINKMHVLLLYLLFFILRFPLFLFLLFMTSVRFLLRLRKKRNISLAQPIKCRNIHLAPNSRQLISSINNWNEGTKKWINEQVHGVMHQTIHKNAKQPHTQK